MTVDTNQITLPAPVRHRKPAPEWSVHKVLREGRNALAREVTAPVSRHVAIAAGYTAVGVLAGVLTVAIAR